MVREDKAAELRRVIESAFEDVPYPGDHNISMEDHCLECQDVADALRGRHWREVSLKYIAEHGLRDALPLLYPAALRFYLPAFMIAIMEDFIEADVLPDFLLGELTPDSHKPCPHFAERLGSLTSEQSHAVRLYLEYFLEEHPEYRDYLGQGPIDDRVMLAIERYWGDK